MIILKFFENPVAERLLCFIKAQTSIFHKAIGTIENQIASVFDVIASMEALKASILSKAKNNFFSNKCCTERVFIITNSSLISDKTA